MIVTDIMASTFIVLLAFLALPYFTGAQFYSDPMAEPWAAIVISACGDKGVNLQETVDSVVTPCLQKMPSPTEKGSPSLPFCDAKDELNACMRPYYDKIKTCFDSEEAKEQIDAAFELQKRNVDYVCKDDQKAFKEMMADFDPQCPAKMASTETRRCKEDASSPDIEELFNINNCKMIKSIQDCTLMAVKNCKNMNLHNYLAAQYDAIMGDDCPPKMPSGGSAVTFAAVLVLLPFFIYNL